MDYYHLWEGLFFFTILCIKGKLPLKLPIMLLTINQWKENPTPEEKKYMILQQGPSV